MQVHTTVRDTTAVITFHNPPVNALPSRLLQDLEVHIRAAGQQADIRSIVLQSEGQTFCAGASFDELLRLEEPEEAAEFFMGFGKVMTAMRDVPKPVIVKVQGKSVGGGNGLIAAADFAVAVEDAAFKLSELSIGIGPFVIAPAIIRKTGIAFFQKMSFSPRKWFSAFDVLKAGLLSHVAENKKRMEETVDHITEAYKKYDPEAVALLKADVWKDTRDWEEILPRQAAKTASLLLRENTRRFLKNLKK